jgi:competence protein ComEC
VLRATATAGLASWAALTGHRQSGLRLLGLAVTALVLIDPFLVYSVGFQLSIGASAGILVLGPAIAARLRGPSLVTEPLAVTLAAQVAVLPLLMGYFGPVSVASVPANLLAGWAAGAVMTWGLTGGVIAGTLPEPLAGWLQRPAWVLVWWLDSVAAWAARLPLPALEPRLLPVAVGLAGSAWLLGGSRARPPDRPVSGSGGRTGRVGVLTAGRAVARLALVAAVAAVAAGAVPRPPATMTELEGGGRWIPGGPEHPSILIVNASADDRLLDEVTGRRILAVDIVVAESGTGPGARLVSAATDITAAGLVLAPPQHRIVGARRVTAELTIVTATGNKTITPSANRLSASLLEPAPHAPADG